MRGVPAACTRSTSAPNPIVVIVLSFILFSSHGTVVLAEGQRTVDLRNHPDAQVSDTARPVFDPNVFKEMPVEADPFFKKLRKKRSSFLRKQLKNRVKFHEKLRKKDYDAEKFQKKLAKFHQKEVEDRQEFIFKQRKKIDKHMEKMNS